jgi:large subunit ribosomal protein L16
MLMPKRTKYRKPHRISYEGKAKGNTKITKGEYGLQAKTAGYVTSKELEAARIAMARFTKRGGKIYTNVFPHLARTQKALETRQGTGKGDVKEWAAVVKVGTILFEISEVDEATAREALRLAGHKLSVTTKFVTKESGENNED